MNMTQTEYLKQYGFSEEGITYCVVGEDTYSIKDELKQLGCKYSKLLKWHVDHVIEVDKNKYKLVKIHFDEVYEWFKNNKPIQKIGAASLVSERLRPVPPQQYEYLDEEGFRKYDIPVELINKKPFMSNYGLKYIYIFITIDKLHKIIWFTDVDKNIDINQQFLLTGTIKSNRIYQDEKTTIMNRCVIKQI